MNKTEIAARPLPSAIVVRGIVEPVLFVLRQPIIECRDGHSEVTYVAFTSLGTRSRTARSMSDGAWDWLRVWETGEPQGWGAPVGYDGETPEQRRAWHERESGMQFVPHGVG